MSDNKSILIKFLKVMAAYFGLYLIHFVIIPNTPLYSNSDVNRFIQTVSYLLFPIVDILFLKSNIAYSFIGVIFYNTCVYIYNANGAYNMGISEFFDRSSYDKKFLLFQINFFIVGYIISYLIIYIIISIIRAIKKHIENKKDREGKI